MCSYSVSLTVHRIVVYGERLLGVGGSQIILATVQPSSAQNTVVVILLLSKTKIVLLYPQVYHTRTAVYLVRGHH